MPEFVLLAAIVELGNEFRRRGMEVQVQRLRRFYRTLMEKQRHPPPGDEMTMENVIEWLCFLRIPPFAGVYKVLGPAAHCPECGEDARFVAYTRSVFPGGSVSACKRCGAIWLQESSV